MWILLLILQSVEGNASVLVAFIITHMICSGTVTIHYNHAINLLEVTPVTDDQLGLALAHMPAY